jgi:hypothetical protein
MTAPQAAEALENATAAGVQVEPPALTEPKKEGRGWARALIDYPGHLLHGAIEAFEAPGKVLASKTPTTSADLIPSALAVGGLVMGGTEFPNIGVNALTSAAEKVLPSTRGVNALVDAIGPENVPEVVAGMRSNPRMTAADLSDPVRQDMQGLMAGGDAGTRDFIARTVRERNATRLEATNTAFTKSMGPAPDTVKMVEGLKQKARDAGQKAIQPAIENAKPVDIGPVISAIDAEIQPGIQGLKSGLPLSPRQEALWRLRNQLEDPQTGEQMFDAQRLHEIQSRTGDQAFNLQKSGDGWTRDAGNGLRDINEKLVDAIDAASGGTYRPARAKFKDAKDISQAYDDGFDVLKNRSGVNGLQDRPEALADWMKTATNEEVVAKRLGVRSDIDQKVNGVKNGALAGQTVTKIPYNQQKLRMLFGEQEANRLIGVMQDAEREAETSYAIAKGSKTAETTASKERLAVREVKGGNPLPYIAAIGTEMLGQSAGLPFLGLAGSAAAKGTMMGVQKGLQMGERARNAAYARNALATGAAEREATMNALLSHPKVLRAAKERLRIGVTPTRSDNALAPPAP